MSFGHLKRLPYLGFPDVPLHRRRFSWLRAIFGRTPMPVRVYEAAVWSRVLARVTRQEV